MSNYQNYLNAENLYKFTSLEYLFKLIGYQKTEKSDKIGEKYLVDTIYYKNMNQTIEISMFLNKSLKKITVIKINFRSRNELRVISKTFFGVKRAIEYLINYLNECN